MSEKQKIEERGNFTGVVKSAFIDSEKLILKMTVEVPDGRVAYPSMFLLDKDGSPSAKSEELLNKLVGWDGQDPMALKGLLHNRTVPFYMKKKGEYWNAYLSDGEKKDDAAAEGDIRSKWAKAKGITLKPVIKDEDLSANGVEIPEEGIPF